MTQLVSPHFTRSEFACNCGCGFNVVDTQLVSILEATRSHFKKKYPDRKVVVIITSGNRCTSYNSSLVPPGARNSYHIKALASDITIPTVHEDEVADYLEETYPYTLGIIRYDGRTHIDMREFPYREDKRTQDTQMQRV